MTDGEDYTRGYRVTCTECDVLDGSTRYELFAERDYVAQQHEHDTGHDVERTPASPEAMTDGGSNPDEPEVHSEGDRIVATANGGVVEAEWETMKRLAKEILSEAEDHKTDLQKAKEMAAGVHIRLLCENCEVEHEAEYARDLIETPQEHVDYPDDDCTLDDVSVEAFCPRHGTVPLSYDECDSCASDRALMNR